MKLRDCKVNLHGITKAQQEQVIACLELQNEKIWGNSDLYNNECNNRVLSYNDNVWYAYIDDAIKSNISLKTFLARYHKPPIKFTI